MHVRLKRNTNFRLSIPAHLNIVKSLSKYRQATDGSADGAYA